MLFMATEYYDLYKCHGQGLGLVKPRSRPLGSQQKIALLKIPMPGQA